MMASASAARPPTISSHGASNEAPFADVRVRQPRTWLPATSPIHPLTIAERKKNVHDRSRRSTPRPVSDTDGAYFLPEPVLQGGSSTHSPTHQLRMPDPAGPRPATGRAGGCSAYAA